MGVKRNNLQLILTLIIFGSIYSLISIVNHYYFRTSALDLGLYTNALYDYSHFQWNDSLTFKSVPENLLADHFDLYLILFSPFSLIFGSYTLIIIQIIAILFGGLGVYYFFKSIQSRLALQAMIFFLSFFAIYSALSFDYHSNVVAAMLVPWFILSIKRENYSVAFVFFMLILIAKENMALWTMFICFALMFDYYKNKKSLKFLFVLIGLSLLYYISIIHFVMPALSNNGIYPHFHYSSLGSNSYEAVKYLIAHPIDSIGLLFKNHTGDEFGNFVKLEFHLIVLFSGGFLLLLKPNYLIMLIPVYFQKLFHDYTSMWSIADHYSIELTPVIAIGCFLVISRFTHKKMRNMWSYILIVLAIISTIRVMDNTVYYTNKANIRFYKSYHYKKPYEVKIVHEFLRGIPSDAPVSVQSSFLPHVALRDKAYQFPLIHDAEYIILSPNESSYPLDEQSYNIKVKEYKDSLEWDCIEDNNDIVILKRK
jgi:uncharacterized membrane protein